MRRNLIAGAQVQREEGRQLRRQVGLVADQELPALRDKDAANRPLVGDVVGQPQLALIAAERPAAGRRG